MAELELSALARVRDGKLDDVGQDRLLAAFFAAHDSGEITYLLSQGQRIAAIVPAGMPESVARLRRADS